MQSRLALPALVLAIAASVLLLRGLPNVETIPGAHGVIDRDEGVSSEGPAAVGSDESVPQSSEELVSASGAGLGRKPVDTASRSELEEEMSSLSGRPSVLLVVMNSTSTLAVGGAKVLTISVDPPGVTERKTDAKGRLRVPTGPGISYVVSSPGFLPTEVKPIEDETVELKEVLLGGFAAVFGKVAVAEGEDASVRLMVDVTGSLSRIIGVSTPRRLELSPIAFTTVSASGDWQIQNVSVRPARVNPRHFRIQVETSKGTRLLPARFTLMTGDVKQVDDPWLDDEPLKVQLVYPSGASLGPNLSIKAEPEWASLDAQPSVTVLDAGPGDTFAATTGDDGWVDLFITPGSNWRFAIGERPWVNVAIPSEPPFRAVVNGYECATGHIVSASTGAVLDFTSAPAQEASQGGGWLRSELLYPVITCPVANGKFTQHMMKLGTETRYHFELGDGDFVYTTEGVADKDRTLRSGDRGFRLSVRRIPRSETAAESFKILIHDAATHGDAAVPEGVDLELPKARHRK